jgi:hypothetical protein
MGRCSRLAALAILSMTTAACSSGFSRPQAQALHQGDGVIYARIDPDPNPNTESTVAPIQITADGRTWSGVGRDPSLPTELSVLLSQPGVAQECDARSGTCYRVISPDGGILLERSSDGGQTWSEVWGVTAGRLDFQDRCCGSRSFAIRDLEYDPDTEVVAVALAEYGLLTLGIDGVVRLETLGRPQRPELGLMTGLFVEPLFAAVLAMVIGWITVEQRLGRVRHEIERRHGSDDHTWLSNRVSQVPIVLPLAFFATTGGVLAAIWRVTRLAESDQTEPIRGWVTLTVAVLLLAGTLIFSHLAQRRGWEADAETSARADFAPAKQKAVRAQAIGTLSTVLSFAALMVPMALWSTGDIDHYDTAVSAALVMAGLIGAALWIWEAATPPLPD